MAVTKIHSIKATLNLSIEYICDEEKTDGKMLVSSFGCEAETADLEFDFTRKSAEGKQGKSTVLAHHLIQAFDPEDNVTPEQAHQLGIELAGKLLKNNHEYVIATHIDKGHIHNHIIFNSVNFNTGLTFHYEQNRGAKVFLRIQKMNDEICREHKLSTIDKKSKNKGKGHYEWEQDNKGTSWKSTLKHTIDDTIKIADNFDDFLEKMRQKNYEVRYEDYKNKEGKILAFKADGQKYYVYAEKLGWYYEEAQLKTRIERCVLRRQHPQKFADDGRVKKLIDINNNEKVQQSAGLERWARIKNLQEASKTINWLSERGITDLKNIDNAGTGIYEKHLETASEIKALEQRMGELLMRRKNIETYKALKHVNSEYLNAKNQDKYFREHESDLLIFESVKKALKRSEGNKLPSVNILEKEYCELENQKEKLLEIYKQSKTDIRDFETIRKNINELIQAENSIKKERS